MLTINAMIMKGISFGWIQSTYWNNNFSRLSISKNSQKDTMTMNNVSEEIHIDLTYCVACTNVKNPETSRMTKDRATFSQPSL